MYTAQWDVESSEGEGGGCLEFGSFSGNGLGDSKASRASVPGRGTTWRFISQVTRCRSRVWMRGGGSIAQRPGPVGWSCGKGSEWYRAPTGLQAGIREAAVNKLRCCHMSCVCRLTNL